MSAQGNLFDLLPEPEPWNRHPLEFIREVAPHVRDWFDAQFYARGAMEGVRPGGGASRLVSFERPGRSPCEAVVDQVCGIDGCYVAPANRYVWPYAARTQYPRSGRPYTNFAFRTTPREDGGLCELERAFDMLRTGVVDNVLMPQALVTASIDFWSRALLNVGIAEYDSALVSIYAALGRPYRWDKDAPLPPSWRHYETQRGCFLTVPWEWLRSVGVDVWVYGPTRGWPHPNPAPPWCQIDDADRAAIERAAIRMGLCK